MPTIFLPSRLNATVSSGATAGCGEDAELLVAAGTPDLRVTPADSYDLLAVGAERHGAKQPVGYAEHHRASRVAVGAPDPRVAVLADGDDLGGIGAYRERHLPGRLGVTSSRDFLVAVCAPDPRAAILRSP